MVEQMRTSLDADRRHALFTFLYITSKSDTPTEIDQTVDLIRSSDFQFCLLDGRRHVFCGVVNKTKSFRETPVRTLGGDYTEEERNMEQTSCNLIMGDFLNLLADSTGRMAGEKVAQCAWLCRFAGHVQEGHVRLLTPSIEDGKYGCNMMDVPSFGFLVNKAVSSTAFLVTISPTDDPTTEKPAVSSTAFTRDQRMALWAKRSTGFPKPVHVFLLIVSGDKRCCIAQSFGCHYRVESWLAFDKDLVRCSTPKPTDASFLSAVAARPRYRGYLSAKETRTLCADMDSLTSPKRSAKEHAKVFGDLTGVALDLSVVPVHFGINVMTIRLRGALGGAPT